MLVISFPLLHNPAIDHSSILDASQILTRGPNDQHTDGIGVDVHWAVGEPTAEARFAEANDDEQF
jgi:hypothetical protein